MSQPVRVRVAPSPTGDPHVGTAYQALFNFAFAKRHGGSFILRIEDTDRARSSAASEAKILESLRWLGLLWDEGPEVGGDAGPYRQSERLTIYREHVDRLLENGTAYRCFCDRERLDGVRAENRDNKLFPGYDRHCRNLDPEESARRAEAGEEHVVRLEVPLDGECVMNDLLRGEIRREWALVDDQVLLKADGFPTYHLANVVDDHLMGISHVIRGEEWINSVPKHLRLYEVFGWEPPVFCHLPLLRNNDKNKSKLSKRKNPTSVEYFRRAGFLPETLVNFLGLLATSRSEGEEKFTLDELIEDFRLEDVTLGGPVFDIQKLRWLNARYIREDHDASRLAQRLEEWALHRERFEAIAPLAQPRLETLGDWGALTSFFFSDHVEIDVADLKIEGYEDSQLAEVLQMVLWGLERLPNVDAESSQQFLRALGEALDIKLRALTRPLYVAITGRPSSTPLFQSIEILGLDLVRARLRDAIELLGGLGAKKLKKLESRFSRLGL